MQKDLVLITYDMPPYLSSLGSAQRMYHLAIECNKKNDMLVITSKKSNVTKMLNIIIPFPIQYIIDPFIRNVNKSTKQSNNLSKLSKFRAWLPFDEYIFWSLRVVLLIFKGQLKSKLFLLSLPPHSISIICLMLIIKKYKYVLDYRDTWNTSTIFRKKTLLLRHLEGLIEKIILNKSIKVVCINEIQKNKICSKFNIDNEKVVIFSNGYDSDNYFNGNVAMIKKSYLKLAYFGDIRYNHRYRDAEVLFSLFSEIKKKIEFKIYFYTNSIKKGPDDNYFLINETVSYFEATRIMKEMDCLLLLHTDNTSGDEVMTGKIFDYLNARKPIIAFGPEKFAAGTFVESLNIGKHINFNQENASEQLFHYLSSIKDNFGDVIKKYEEEFYMQFSRQYINKEYGRFLDTIINNNS